MESKTTSSFQTLLANAPTSIQLKAKTSYLLWSENTAHPSLRFKKVHATLPIYSVRIDLNWRAVGTLQGDTMLWFWIGAHNEYEKLLAAL